MMELAQGDAEGAAAADSEAGAGAGVCRPLGAKSDVRPLRAKAWLAMPRPARARQPSAEATLN